MRGKRFVLREEVALLEAPPEPPPSVAFLPPFDPLVWDRRLLGEPVRLRLRVGALHPAGQAAVGLVRAADPLPRPPRRPDRAADRPGRAAACRCSASGGRTASRRAAPTGSSTRCATRCAPTSASPARPGSSGRRTSERRSGSSPRAPRARSGGLGGGQRALECGAVVRPAVGREQRPHEPRTRTRRSTHIRPAGHL